MTNVTWILNAEPSCLFLLTTKPLSCHSGHLYFSAVALIYNLTVLRGSQGDLQLFAEGLFGLDLAWDNFDGDGYSYKYFSDALNAFYPTIKVS